MNAVSRPAPSPHLLEGKFQPQIGAREHLPRTRLALPGALVDGPVRCVAVVAPTGYGKSTLMAQWHATLSATHPARPCVAWLNLDANDDDPRRLLKYVYGALGRCLPALTAEAAIEITQTADPPVVLEELSIALAAHASPVVLFLDDAQIVTHPDSVAILDWLLHGAGAGLRTVVGSRQALGGATAELRVRGQLLEFDQHSLAFDEDEAQVFCNSRLARRLDARTLDRLLERTEGWPAAMELLTLLLDEAPDPGRLVAEFATTERSVLEYLSEAVFGRLAPTLRTLVHGLAQFDRFCPDLAAAALDTATPDALFGELVRRHLFLIPLDVRGRWFRFHHLVADYLRRHDPRDTSAVADSLARGSRWLFDQGMVDDAIDCAVRAREWNLACQWLDRAAEDAAQRLGDGANLLRWIPAIPADVLDHHPRIRLSQAFSRVFNRRTPELERELVELEAFAARLHADGTGESRDVDELRCAVVALRMMWDALRDDVDGLRARAERWLAEWPRARPLYRGEVFNVAAFGCKTGGDIVAGLAYCDRGEAAHASDGGQFGMSWAQVLRALLHLKRGDYRAALAAADTGLQHVDEALHGHPELAAYLQAVRAAAFYDFDDIARATEALEAHPDALDDRGTSDFLLLTHLTRARLQFRASRTDAGFAALQLGRKLGLRLGLPRVSVTLAGEECVWLCRLGQVAAAKELARAQDFDRTLHPHYGVVADKAVRVAPRLLMAEHPDMAVAQLGPALVRATEKGYQHRRVELLLLHAAALLRSGRTTEAVESWRIAIGLGERYGYRRVFLDDADIVGTLNHAARGHGECQVPSWLKLAPSRNASRDDALTRKELRILKCLETGASNHEIAASLFVSEGTLKWHLHNVYRKLGCRNRSGAVAAARRRGLL